MTSSRRHTTCKEKERFCYWWLGSVLHLISRELIYYGTLICLWNNLFLSQGIKIKAILEHHAAWVGRTCKWKKIFLKITGVFTDRELRNNYWSKIMLSHSVNRWNVSCRGKSSSRKAKQNEIRHKDYHGCHVFLVLDGKTHGKSTIVSELYNLRRN